MCSHALQARRGCHAVQGLRTKPECSIVAAQDNYAARAVNCLQILTIGLRESFRRQHSRSHFLASCFQ
jgi:hypothetical protein